jgi:hypothetical protein
MLRTVPNHRGFTASLLALSLVTVLSLVGCGSDVTTAPERGGGDISTIDDTFNRDDGSKTPRDDEKRFEDGR